MNSNPASYYAVVPAAGVGSRAGGDIPKQYFSLLGKPVLRHTLELLHSFSWIKQIVLVHANGDAFVDDNLLLGLDRVTTTVGGGERAESVLCGINALSQAEDNDWVLVHDAVRPCVPASDIENLKQSLYQNSDQAGILASPVRETLKMVDDSGYITSTLDRTGLWQAATPQQCRVGILHSALLQSQGNSTITDEASALELRGIPVKVVQGSPDNIKITYSEDMLLAQMIIKSRNTKDYLS